MGCMVNWLLSSRAEISAPAETSSQGGAHRLLSSRAELSIWSVVPAELACRDLHACIDLIARRDLLRYAEICSDLPRLLLGVRPIAC